MRKSTRSGNFREVVFDKLRSYGGFIDCVWCFPCRVQPRCRHRQGEPTPSWLRMFCCKKTMLFFLEWADIMSHCPLRICSGSALHTILSIMASPSRVFCLSSPTHGESSLNLESFDSQYACTSLDLEARAWHGMYIR
jgi:hypothetical protein